MKGPPCPCCGEPMVIRPTSSQGKPMLKCDEGCVVQVLIKSQRGVRLFTEKYPGWNGDAPPPAPKQEPAAKKEPAKKTPATGGESKDSGWLL